MRDGNNVRYKLNSFSYQTDLGLWVLWRHSSSFFNLVGVTLATPGDAAGLTFMCVGGAKGCAEGKLTA